MLYDIQITKRFVDGPLEGLHHNATIPQCSIDAVKSWVRRMEDQDIIKPVAGGSSYIVVYVGYTPSEIQVKRSVEIRA